MLKIGKIAIVMLAAASGLFLALAEPAKAGEAGKSGDSEIIAQSTDSGQQKRPRLRNSFFEQERKLFGLGDFLDSALDGVQNVFGADNQTNLSEETSLDALSSIEQSGLEAILTVSDFNDNDRGDFLNTTLVGDGVNLSFSNSQPNSDERTGTIVVNGNVGELQFNGIRVNYNAGFSSKNDDVSGVIQLTDPNNPGRAIFIQLPRTGVEGVGDLNSDNDRVSGRARLSIGLPSDR